MRFIDRGAHGKTIVSRLPLLEVVASFYTSRVLDDAYVLAAQHLLGTSADLFESLFRLGLDRDCFSVIGKCYSTDPSVYFNLKFKKGLDVCESSGQFAPLSSFDDTYAENIQKFLDARIGKILESGCRKLIVVDDGGVLIQAVNLLLGNGIFPSGMKVIGVEQTSSGFTKLKAADLLLPVINVARSDLKLHLESSIIAEAILKNLWVACQEIGFEPTQALVLGRGAIGAKVEEKMSFHCPVDSFDPARIEECSIHHVQDIDFQRYDLILGCSGKETMEFANLPSLGKGTVLASGSSSDREFEAVAFRKQLIHQPKCHEHICVKGIHLLNCGFPVNFSSNFPLVDDDRYQLTRSLLLAGILQAHSQAGVFDQFIDLNASVQHAINEQFFVLYPDFAQEYEVMDISQRR